MVSEVLGSALYKWPPYATAIRDSQFWSSTSHLILLPVQISLEIQIKLTESKWRFESNYLLQQRGKSFQWRWGLAKWQFHQLQKPRPLLRGWRFHSWQTQQLQLRKKNKTNTKKSQKHCCNWAFPIEDISVLLLWEFCCVFKTFVVSRYNPYNTKGWHLILETLVTPGSV